MKTIVKCIMIVSVLIFNACVELPNLIPNGEGAEQDMIVQDYEEIEINPEDFESVVVSDLLTVNFVPLNPSEQACGTFGIKIQNGQILNGNPLFQEYYNQNGFGYLGLSEGDLLGGLVGGDWKNNFSLANMTFSPFGNCIIDPNAFYQIAKNRDVILGIRVKNEFNQWHYGWIVLYLEEEVTGEPPIQITLNHLRLRLIAHNKVPGTNVRISN